MALKVGRIMQIAICDDDALIVEQLQKYLEQYFRKHHLSCPKTQHFSSGDALLSDMNEKDLVFLDVEMPGVDGIYTGKKLREKYPNIIIIIISSYMEYLDDAMRFHVFRYLSKPIDRQRLFCNLDDALKQYHSISAKIVFETKGSVHTLAPSSIITVEAVSKRSVVHTTSADYETIHPMQYWSEHLPSTHFFQTHRSFFVNMEHVVDFDHMTVQMDVPRLNAYLTQRKYHAFKDAYLLFLESMR